MIAFKIGYFKGEYCKGRKFDQYYWVSIRNKENDIIRSLCSKNGKVSKDILILNILTFALSYLNI